MKKLVVGVVFVAVAAASFFYGRMSVSPVKASEGAEVASADAAKLERATKRIAELEKQLAAALKSRAARSAAAAKSIPAEAAAREKSVVVSGGTNVDIFAELKKNLSEEDFNKTTNVLENLKAKLAAKARGKMDFLKAVETAAMTPKERDNHAKFIELIERREGVRAKMKGGIPDQQSIQEMVEIEMQMRPLAKKERTVLSRELARELGYAGEDAETVCDAIGNIIDCTSGGGMLDGLMDAADGASGAEVGAEVQVIGL